jgi:outer membrane protein assembly factor BamB
MTTKGILGSALAFLCVSQVVNRADDWPQWRGPHRDGISQEKGLLKEWPKEGPKQLWAAKNLGAGYSTPSVVGSTVYLLGNEGLENESIKALSAEKGETLWSTRLGKVGNPNQKPAYPGARSTATVDRQMIYALGSDGDLVCLDKSGKVKWQKNVRSEFRGQPGVWAYSESPLVDGNSVVVTPGGAEATMVALNKNTGEVIWKSAIPGGEQAAYASIVTAEIGGKKQYVQFLQKGVVGVEAKSGAFLWRYDRVAQGSPANIPTPVVFGNYVYASTGRGGGGLIKLNTEGAKIEPEAVYHETKVPTAIGGAVKIGDYLYGTSQSLLCLEFMSGNQKWEDRGVGAGSICYADGRLYLHGENGEVALVEATPEGYREKGRFTPADAPSRGPSKAWAYPAVSNGRLYIFDSGTLYCYDIKQ